MTMHQGLDLSRFKKVSSDSKSTTLRHSKGHEIKIAHGGLTPAMRDHINAMPAVMKDGGMPPEKISDELAQDFLTAPSAKNAPAVLAPEQSANKATGQELDSLASNLQTAPPEPVAEGFVPEQQFESDGQIEPASYTPDMPVWPEQPAEPQVQQVQPPVIKSASQELKEESVNIANDQISGHINPKTYNELLYANKGTLGKIGTFFGLLIGGAGAGLSHQPNALLGMMDKEIANDLEMQKQNQGNKLNLARVKMEREMHMAKLDQMKQEGILNDQQLKVAKQEWQIKHDAHELIRKRQGALHTLVTMANKYAPGTPQRSQIDQRLAVLAPEVQNANFDLADQTEAKIAMMRAIYNPASHSGGGQGDTESEFRARQAWLQQNGQEKRAEEEKKGHIPGIRGIATTEITADDRKAIRTATNFQSQLDRFINWTRSHSGDLSPTDITTGKAMAAELSSAYRASIDGGVYKAGEQEFIDQIIDSDPTKFFNSIRVLPKLEVVKNNSVHKLNDHLKSLGFEGYEAPQQQQQNQLVMGRDGKQYYKVPGGYMPAQQNTMIGRNK